MKVDWCWLPKIALKLGQGQKRSWEPAIIIFNVRALHTVSHPSYPFLFLPFCPLTLFSSSLPSFISSPHPFYFTTFLPPFLFSSLLFLPLLTRTSTRYGNTWSDMLVWTLYHHEETMSHNPIRLDNSYLAFLKETVHAKQGVSMQRKRQVLDSYLVFLYYNNNKWHFGKILF